MARDVGVNPTTHLDGRFLVEDFQPAYLSVSKDLLGEKVEAGLRELEDCHACPRNCGVNRMQDLRKVCNTGRHAIVSSAFPHFGEEDCLRGWRGSGTIFFGLCNLRCVFCQNWDISQVEAGSELSGESIAEIAIQLQQRGCHNINFVTPEHVVPQVIETIAAAIPLGLNLPIVYNTSAYDSLDSLRLMEGLVDIYMPDFKFWEYRSARDYAKAKDYAEVARAAISEMHRQVGELRFGADGLAKRGLLVRHLVMPGQTEETAAIMGWLADDVSPDTYVNIMDQYTPQYQVGDVARSKTGKVPYPAINRPPTGREIAAAYTVARDAGLWRFDERAGQASGDITTRSAR